MSYKDRLYSMKASGKIRGAYTYYFKGQLKRAHAEYYKKNKRKPDIFLMNTFTDYWISALGAQQTENVRHIIHKIDDSLEDGAIIGLSYKEYKERATVWVEC